MARGSLFGKVRHLCYQCWWVKVSSCSLEGLNCRHQLGENTLVLNIIQAEGMIINRVMNVAICFGYSLRKSNMQNRPLWQTLVVVPHLEYLQCGPQEAKETIVNWKKTTNLSLVRKKSTDFKEQCFWNAMQTSGPWGHSQHIHGTFRKQKYIAL